MTALQKINQGTAPAGSDGDTVRSAFSKVNSNVDVLNTQAALTSSAVITAAQALTNAHVGKRVNINLTSAGTINMPAASTCAADQVTLLRNIGTTVVTLAITTGSGDTVALSKLNPGETALMDTDGVHAWNVLMRGRANSDNEVVNGNEAVGGTLSVAGLSTFSGGAAFGNSGQATISSAGAYSGVSAAYTGNVSVGGLLSQAGSGNQKAYMSGGYVFSSNTGNNGTADKFIEMYHDGTTSGLAVGNGSSDQFGGLITTTTTLKPAGIAQIFGRNVPVLSAFFSGSTASLASATVLNCSCTYLAAGKVRVTLNTPFQNATHMLLVGGIAASNGTNWCVPTIVNFAGDGSYVDIQLLATGNGAGVAIEGILSLTVLKVR
ncbi:hypothetical protein [Burkholderia vietnamiensis]|jgi:hypothetical protein|uniref:hypothetical protein n=4 Tax=Burkholderia vietnamiensis TaxID=60552 RepID=UPI000ABF960D|nr:hypothetical protein [Burkholderia vietnamiensis]MCA7985294.1 hypothetical protein [Burkholderia vietnamiensis]HDR8932965.1 hypothetical protein [Burkholderia vietnamiensis]